ncbi:CpaF family protein [Ilumatobacter nonamiensis]|uniref:CpaF family protein n=1 Tax=Ilumatobacter nonamiensis TaxID=467093 RepID=UPI0003492CF1|nr:ATPase, T2SS/T4P/T4SS family [Ilumatobacter nonamiensis]
MTPDGLVDAVCRSIRDETGDLDDLVDRAVRRLAPLTTTDQRRQLRIDATAQMRGLGELDRLVDDPDIDEVLVTGDQIWVDRDGRVETAGVLHGTTVEQVIERILAPIGRRVDRTTPIVDARLSNGARVCAVVPPVAVGGASLSIRRFSEDVRSIADFTGESGEELIRAIVADRLNVVVCGATSSGKTSLLAAMLDAVDDIERLIVLEDTTELPCRAPHVVRLEARPATAEGVRPVSLTDLVRTALRLRPDRLVVGEVRSDECLALVQAMNTGHDGSFSTCHANGPLDALLRLESLVLQAAPQWPLSAVRQQLARSIDIVVHVGRQGRSRRILEICEVDPPSLDGRLGAPTVRSLACSSGGDLVVAARPNRTRR